MVNRASHRAGRQRAGGAHAAGRIKRRSGHMGETARTVP